MGRGWGCGVWNLNVRLWGPREEPGKEGEGQRKQDLAEAPTSPIKKQPPRQPLTPHENLCQDQGGGKGIQTVGPLLQRQGRRAGVEGMALRIWVMLGQVSIPQWGEVWDLGAEWVEP